MALAKGDTVIATYSGRQGTVQDIRNHRALVRIHKRGTSAPITRWVLLTTLEKIKESNNA